MIAVFGVTRIVPFNPNVSLVIVGADLGSDYLMQDRRTSRPDEHGEHEHLAAHPPPPFSSWQIACVAPLGPVVSV